VDGGAVAGRALGLGRGVDLVAHGIEHDGVRHLGAVHEREQHAGDERDLVLTRDYLAYLRQTMGRAVSDFEPFDDAYARTDWSRFAKLPAFEQANRMNAYGTYLLMEQELLSGNKQ
jgi:hypothetical protein